MAMLTIASENPMFSFAISKNPTSGVVARSVRSGVGYGWYTHLGDKINVNEYNLMFEECAECLSFSSERFAHNDHSSVTSPSAYLALFDSLLRENTKAVTDNDGVYEHVITLTNISTYSPKAIEHLTKHLDCQIDSVETADRLFTIVISKTATLYETLAYARIVLMFLTNDQAKAKFTTDYYTKYAKLLADVNVPYYVRYMFLRNFSGSSAQFDVLATLLTTPEMSFVYGDTRWHRFCSISKALGKDPLPILDVGCGEGYFTAKKEMLTGMKYTGVDIDAEVLDIAERKANARDIDAEFYTDVNLVPVTAGKENIILTEVIEHMPVKESAKLIETLMERNFNKIVVTVPNRSFNINYGLADEFRHDDHDWEPTRKEFHSFITEVVGDLADVEFSNIGDCVNGEYESTQAVIRTMDDHKPHAIICVGAPGSGKSTYCEYIMNRYNTEHEQVFVEVNRDNIRFPSGVKDWSKWTFNHSNEARVTAKIEKQLHNHFGQRKNIIFSDTNANIVYRTKLVQRLQEEGYTVEFKVFNVDFDTLLERNNNRAGGVPYEVLLGYYIRMQRAFGGVEFEDYENRDNQECFYVIDVDGTLLNIDHRSPFDSASMINDTVNAPVANLVRSIMSSGDNWMVFSGRNEKDRSVTKEVIERELRICVPDEKIIMRKDEDFRPDHLVKYEMWLEHVHGKNYRTCAIDDRKQVIEQCWNVINADVISVGKCTDRF